MLNPTMLWPYSVPGLNYIVQRDHSLNRRILDDLWREYGPRAAVSTDAPMTFVTRGGYISAETMRWLSFTTGRRLAFSDVYADNNLETFRQLLRDATFVVAAEDNAAGVYNQNAAWEVRFEVNRMIVENPDLRLLHRYPTSPGGPAYELFVNDANMMGQFSDFGDFQALEGFLPMEGPYPQWKLGKVQWAVGQQSRFAQIERAGRSAGARDPAAAGRSAAHHRCAATARVPGVHRPGQAPGGCQRICPHL